MAIKTELNRLLNKKGWTGEEIGRAMILSLCDEYRRTLQGEKDIKPLFPPERIYQMVGSITNSYDGKRYNRYVGLQNWLQRTQAAGQTFKNVLALEDNFIRNEIGSSILIERLNNASMSSPLILSRQQYEAKKAERLEWLQHEHEGVELDAGQLLLITIHALMGKLATEPKKANPLKAIRKAYLKQRLTTDYVRRAYADCMALGYYALPDGTTTEGMTEEEEQAALSPYWHKKAAKADPVELFKADIEKHRAAAEGRDPDEEQHEAEDGPRFIQYAEAPATVSKWEALEECGVYELFEALDDPEAEPEDHAEQAQALADEYPEIVAAALADMAKRYPAILGAVKGLPVEEWEGFTVAWADLYAADFYGIRAGTERESFIFDGNRRALLNGVAILTPDSESHLGEAGVYTDPTPDKETIFSLGLRKYLPENPEYLECIKRAEQARANIEYSLKWALGFDAAIDMIAAYIEIPEFTIFKLGAEALAARVEETNKLLGGYYDLIGAYNYANPADEQLLLGVMRDVFYPLRVEELRPPEKVLAEAKALLLDDMKAFEAQDMKFIHILTEWREA